MPESANRQWLRLANHINRFPGSPDFGNPDFRSQQNDSSAAEPVFGAIRHASASVLGPEMGRRPARPRRRRNRAPFTGIRPETGLRGNRGRTSRFFLKIRIPGNPDFLKKSGQISSSAATPVFGAIRLASASVLGPKMGLRPARPRRRRNRAPFTGIRPETGLRGNRGRTSRFFLKSGFREIRIS